MENAECLLDPFHSDGIGQQSFVDEVQPGGVDFPEADFEKGLRDGKFFMPADRFEEKLDAISAI